MDHVLLDTDVLLDFFFDRTPYSNHTAVVLHQCEEQKIKGFVTPVIIANLYYLLRKTAKHEMVIDKLNQLLSILEIAEMNSNVVIQSLQSDFKDFEDALQHFTAIEQKNIHVILTRNTKDFKHSALAVLTPEAYLSGNMRKR